MAACATASRVAAPRGARRARTRSGRSRAARAPGAPALLERLGVPERERGQACERPEHEVASSKAAVSTSPRRDAERLARPDDGRDDRVREVAVRRVRPARRRASLAAITGRPLELSRERARSARELVPDQRLRQAVHGRAARARRVARRAGSSRRRRRRSARRPRRRGAAGPLERQLARHRLARLEQRGLLGAASAVVREQAGGADREACLVSDGLGERDAVGRPGPAPARCSASTPIIASTRRSGRRRGTAAELEQRSRSSERLQLGRGLCRRRRRPFAGRRAADWRDRHRQQRRLADRLEALGGPLRLDRSPARPPSRTKQRDRPSAAPSSRSGDLEHAVEVELRAQSAAIRAISRSRSSASASAAADRMRSSADAAPPREGRELDLLGVEPAALLGSRPRAPATRSGVWRANRMRAPVALDRPAADLLVDVAGVRDWRTPRGSPRRSRSRRLRARDPAVDRPPAAPSAPARTAPRSAPCALVVERQRSPRPGRRRGLTPVGEHAADALVVVGGPRPSEPAPPWSSSRSRSSTLRLPRRPRRVADMRRRASRQCAKKRTAGSDAMTIAARTRTTGGPRSARARPARVPEDDAAASEAGKISAGAVELRERPCPLPQEGRHGARP